MDLFYKLVFIISLIFNNLDLLAQEWNYTGSSFLSPDFQKFEVLETDKMVLSDDPSRFIPAPYHYAELVSATGESEYRRSRVNRRTNPPWVLISAGPFLAGGLMAHFKTRQLHNDYLLSADTDQAVKLHDDVKQMQVIRTISFGVAGLLGVSGILFYKKQFRKNRKVQLQYLPFACGGSIGLTF